LRGDTRIMASLFKGRLRELSGGAFDESQQGDKNFRSFLERHADLVGIESEGSVLYVTQPATGPATVPAQSLPPDELLATALASLLKEQPRVRASLLKQRISEMSGGRFNENELGYENFRAFLEEHSQFVALQQHDSTLFVTSPRPITATESGHLTYRSELKKQGMRVIPAAVRLPLLNLLVGMLPARSGAIQWQALLDSLKGEYDRLQPEPVSKSMINDLLRLAQRARLIEAVPRESLASAPVTWLLAGERPFQEAVMHCDAAYLRVLMRTFDELDLEQASMALYEESGRARYLKVILKRLGGA
jgi:hypothetical protein